MGFTPLEGLVMATRSGTVDPGAVLWLQTHAGLTADGGGRRASSTASGWSALAGTADMREVVERARAGDVAAGAGPRRRRPPAAGRRRGHGRGARRPRRCSSFTGGVGEHAPAVRAAGVEGLGFLGIALDAEADAAADPDVEVTAAGPSVRTFVVAAREDVEIARAVRGLVAPA